MEIVSKKKNKDGTTEFGFGDKKAMVSKISKIGTSTGYMMKPKSDPNLKIRATTQAEKNMEEMRKPYQKNGKTTFKGAAKLMGDVVKTVGKRIIGKE